MVESTAPKRLSKVAGELNVATTTIVDFLKDKNISIELNPNAKISDEIYQILKEKFQSDKIVKEYAEIKKQEIKEKEREREKEEQSRIIARAEESAEILIKSNLLTREVAPKKAKVEELPPVIKEEIQEIIEIIPVEPEKIEPEPVIEIPIEVPEVIKEEVKIEPEEIKEEVKEDDGGMSLTILGKIDLDQKKPERKPETRKKKVEPEVVIEPVVEEIIPEVPEIKETIEVSVPEPEIIPDEIEIEIEPEKIAEVEIISEKDNGVELQGLTIIGKIDVEKFESDKGKKKPIASTSDPASIHHKRRKKIFKKPEEKKEVPAPVVKKETRKEKFEKRHKDKDEIDEKVIKDQISATLAKLTGKQQGAGVIRAKIKKQKKKEQKEKELLTQSQDQVKVIEVIEFITVNELANMLNVGVTDVITTCMHLGLMVSINQRLDAETITIVADEFGYEVVFTKESVNEPELEEMDNPDRMVERAPVVTIMGHVDHGKTSLLDYIRKSRIIEGEAGGITQHIGAYEVFLPNGKKIAFLDTPGHEAFTSMRARGAKITDIVIIVIAADDSVMPQTREAISHSQAAGVQMVFAINKMDKDGANPERIREQLAEMNILVEDWGGKFQCQEISAKKGLNIELLLEKVLLEAEMLDLKADIQKRAKGTVIEAALDKGKGITTTILVQKGTLKVGDPVIAGAYFGKVKALLDEKGKRIQSAGPSTPVVVLGFDGSPTAGDVFYVTENDAIAKEIATQRKRLMREQGIRATKHVTLDEIGRRIALGNFRELNVIIKGDVDGSVEALADSLQKLSSEEVQVNIIHKGVGQISESDVLLASASDAVIVGFQVRPSLNARKLAESEQIDIRHYSVIYDAIEEIKLAIEGLLAPEEEEKIVCNVEVREVFKVSKVGTIAGCKVIEGKISRNTNIRVLREGVVVFTGEIASLKRVKDDVKEVSSGFECGIGVRNFNDIKVGDIIEGYTIEQIKRKL